MVNNKVIIGNEEWCAFPGLGVPAIKARVDSGAKTSALHAFNIQRFESGSSQWVSFDVHPLQNNRELVVHCQAPVCDKRWVKSSSGLSEKRYVIKVPMQLGPFLWDIEVTLTNRDSMGYRMLLGRNAMQDLVLVDPSQGCYLGEPDVAQMQNLYPDVVKSKQGLNIGLLAISADLYSNQRLLETARERGHNIRFIDIKNTALQFADGQARCYVGNDQVDGIDVIIPRFPASLSPYACSLLQHFQQQGAFAINSANAIRQARDILSTLQVLQKHQLPLAAYSFAPDAGHAKAMIEQVGGAPLLLKNLSEDTEKAYVLAKNAAAAESIIQAMQGRGLAVYAQGFYKESNKRLVRCLVLQDKVLAAVEKPVRLMGSNSKKRRVTAATLTSEETALVLRAANTMNLCLAGIDIVRSEKGPLVFGITPNPGFEDIENMVDINIAQALFTVIEDKFPHKVVQHA